MFILETETRVKVHFFLHAWNFRFIYFIFRVGCFVAHFHGLYSSTETNEERLSRSAVEIILGYKSHGRALSFFVGRRVYVERMPDLATFDVIRRKVIDSLLPGAWASTISLSRLRPLQKIVPNRVLEFLVSFPWKRFVVRTIFQNNRLNFPFRRERDY